MQIKQMRIRGKDSGMCFGCGQKNSVGLRLRPENDNGIARASFTPR